MLSREKVFQHTAVLKGLFGILAVVWAQGITNFLLRTTIVVLVLLWLMISIGHLEVEYHKLKRAVAVDELTGLGNFRAFQERLRIEIERSKRTGAPLVLVLIDLDQFKRYNDSYGHRRGNEFLRTSGEAFVQAVRVADGVYRFGGDEFALVLPGTDIEEARNVVMRVRNAFDKLDVRAMVTLSVGVSSYQGETLEEFFDRVDSLLYDVKSRRTDGCRDEMRVAELTTV